MEISPKWIFFALVLVVVAFELLADMLFKKWAQENKLLLLGIGLGLYFIGTIFWAFSLRQEYLSKAIVVFTLINLIGGVVMGMVYFQEELSLLQKAVIGLGMLSVVLIEWPS